MCATRLAGFPARVVTKGEGMKTCPSSVSLVLAAAVVGTAVAVVASPAESRDEVAAIRERTVAHWPAQGAIHALYDDGLNPTYVGYDFATGAWYRRTRRNIVGQDTAGELYSCRIEDQEYKPLASASRGFGFFIDRYFPTLEVAWLLDHPELVTSVAESADGLLRVEATLPRASRGLDLERIPAPELERWGGHAGVHRAVVYTIGTDGRVLSIERQGLQGPERDAFDRAECSLPGFHVAGHPDESDRGFQLQSCEYQERPDASSFDGRLILSQAVAEASRERARMPVERPGGDADAARPHPITSRPESGRWSVRAWIGLAGGGVAATGLVLLLFRRLSRGA